MTSVQNPLYKTNEFVVDFYKDQTNDQLSLATAKKYFVQIFGLNILKGYYYFRNTINCDDQIAAKDLISNDQIVCNKITTNNIMTQKIKANKIYCDELVVSKTPTPTPTIYAYIYVDNLSIPIIGSESDLNNFCIPIKKLVQILLLKDVKIVCSILASTKIKLIKNDSNNCKMFYVDLSLYDKFDLYFDNRLIN